MGLFDGLFATIDIIKGGVAAAKASERIEQLVEQSMDEYEDKLTADNKRLYRVWSTKKKNYDKAVENDSFKDDDERNAEMEAVENAAVQYLMSLGANPSLPSSFKTEVKQGIAEYEKANDLPYELLEKRFMKMAKTDEEREFVRQCMEEAKKDE